MSDAAGRVQVERHWDKVIITIACHTTLPDAEAKVQQFTLGRLIGTLVGVVNLAVSGHSLMCTVRRKIAPMYILRCTALLFQH